LLRTVLRPDEDAFGQLLTDLLAGRSAGFRFPTTWRPF
jgi:hypothetical protein